MSFHYVIHYGHEVLIYNLMLSVENLVLVVYTSLCSFSEECERGATEHK